MDLVHTGIDQYTKSSQWASVGYRLTMKMLFYAAILLAMICFCLIVLNAYDFMYRDDLPWKEGDFKAIMLRCIGGLIGFSLVAILMRHMVKANR